MAMLQNWLTIGLIGPAKIASPAAVAAGIDAIFDQLAATGRPIVASASLAGEGSRILLQAAIARRIPYLLQVARGPEPATLDGSLSPATTDQDLIKASLNTFEVQADSMSDALLDAGVRVVDDSVLLIVVRNATPGLDPGHVERVYQYCRELGKPAITIDSDSGTVAPDSKEILNQIGPVPSGDSGALHRDPRSPRAQVEAELARLSEEANRHAPAARALMIRLILLNLLVAGLSSIVIALAFPEIFIRGAMILKLSALILVLYWTRRRKRIQVHWAVSRYGTELCRSCLGIWEMPRQREVAPPIRVPACRKLARTLRILWFLARDDARDPETARRSYLENRVLDQRRYYSQHGDWATLWLPRLRRGATAATVIAIAATLVHSALSWFLGSELPAVRAVDLLSSVLPLASAALLSLVIAWDLPRRAVWYSGMTTQLDQQAQAIRAAPGLPALLRAVAATEQLLLQELADWYNRNRSSEMDKAR